MKKFCTIITLLCSAFIASASGNAEVYLQTDLVSSYLWRGEYCGGVSIQPEAGVKWNGFHFFVWADTPLCPADDEAGRHEIDLFLKYSFKPGFTVGLKNVYINTRGSGFFSYGSIPHAANGLDVMLRYDCRYFGVKWSTTVAGYDGYNHQGSRAYGSYFMANAPFSLAWFDWDARIGVVPYYCSRYTDDRSAGFHVNMCALRMAHTFRFDTSGISITPSAELMLNPSSRKTYFAVGASFVFNPSQRVKKDI